MTPPRLFAIAFILVATSVAWSILGVTVQARTGESDGELRQEVAQLWGGRHRQVAPKVWIEEPRVVTRQVQENDSTGRPVHRTVTETVYDQIPLSLEQNRIDVTFDLDQRQKGLLWYDTYAVRFEARYHVSHHAAGARHVRVHFAFPSPEGIYDGFQIQVGGQDAREATDLSAGITADVVAEPGVEVPIRIGYRSRGLDDWTYAFGDGVAQVRDFALVAHTDFTGIDFPAGTMSPTAKKREGRGWRLEWKFESLATGQKVGLDMPNRQNPGPLAARIAYFAPVSLLFFVTVMVIVGVLRGRSLHPMNYVFLSAAFFAFHLLLAYLVDHLDVHLSFAISAGVSVFLVVTYLWLAAGLRVAVLEAGVAQGVFLVLFSYAFFFEGYTGLTVTVGAIVTLFVLMLVTGRMDWGKVFARSPSATLPSPSAASSGA
jgi:inner membrane protein involved in colicin E2 resistance